MVLGNLHVEITKESVRKYVLRLTKWKECKHTLYIADSYTFIKKNWQGKLSKWIAQYSFKVFSQLSVKCC